MGRDGMGASRSTPRLCVVADRKAHKGLKRVTTTAGMLEVVDEQLDRGRDGFMKWVLEATRLADDDRFAAHGTSHATVLYNDFVAAKADCAARGRCDRQPIVRLLPFYDTRSYQCRDIPSRHPGSLKLIFNYYCRLMAPTGVSTGLNLSSGLTYDLIQVANETMSLPELMIFATDFNLVPDLTSNAAVHFCWQRQRRSRKHDAMPTELDYRSFVEVLVRLALIAFSEEADPKERVRNLVRYLNLNETVKYRKMLSSLERSRKGKTRATKAVGRAAAAPESSERGDPAALDRLPGTAKVKARPTRINFKLESNKRKMWSEIRSWEETQAADRARRQRKCEIEERARDQLAEQQQRRAEQVVPWPLKLRAPDANSEDGDDGGDQEALNATADSGGDGGLGGLGEDETGSLSSEDRAFLRQGHAKRGLGEVPTYASSSLQNRARKSFWQADNLFAPSLLDLLAEFEFENDRVLWLPFDGEFLDMGVLVKGSVHYFRVEVQNVSRDSLSIDVDVCDELDDVTATFDARSMPMGMQRRIVVRVDCRSLGETLGALRVTSRDSKGRVVNSRELPVYVHVVEPSSKWRRRGTQRSDTAPPVSKESAWLDAASEDSDGSELVAGEGQDLDTCLPGTCGSLRPPSESGATDCASQCLSLSPKHRSKSTIVTGLSLPSPMRRLTSTREISGRVDASERKPLPISLIPESNKPRSLASRRASMSASAFGR